MASPSRSPSPSLDADLFADPQDFYPPSPPPTTLTYDLTLPPTSTIPSLSLDSKEKTIETQNPATSKDSKKVSLNLTLIGHSPLWAHHLWNGARILTTFLLSHPTYITSHHILELGAGVGLPSICAALLHASSVVSSDWPDQKLVDNLRHNILSSVSSSQIGGAKVAVEGFKWGDDPDVLLRHIRSHSKPNAEQASSHGEKKFDTVLMADLLFNHTCHKELLHTLTHTLAKPSSASKDATRPPPTALVFFTPYRPWLLNADLAFFDLCREAGLSVELLLEEKMEKVMFENDRGDEEVRKTCWGYAVRWKE